MMIINRNKVNSYPWALENRLSLIYVAELDKINAEFIPKIIKDYARELEVDNLKNTLDNFMDNSRIAPATFDKILKRFGQSMNFWQQNKMQKAVIDSAREVGLLPIEIPLTGALSSTLLTQWTTRNANLISEIILENGQAVSNLVSKKIIEDTARLTQGAITKSQSIRELSKEIKKTTGVIRRKADFWARDQLKLGYKDLEKARYREAQIPGYLWMTVGDGRVRPEHRQLHGVFFKEGELSNQPGDEILCRCTRYPAQNRSQQLSKSAREKEISFMKADEKNVKRQVAIDRGKKKARRIKKAKTIKPVDKAKRTARIGKDNDKKKRLIKNSKIVRQKLKKRAGANPNPGKNVVFNEKKIDYDFLKAQGINTKLKTSVVNELSIARGFNDVLFKNGVKVDLLTKTTARDLNAYHRMTTVTNRITKELISSETRIAFQNNYLSNPQAVAKQSRESFAKNKAKAVLVQENKIKEFNRRIAKGENVRSWEFSEVFEKLDQLKAMNRWSISSIAKDPLYSTAVHESGHALMYKNLNNKIFNRFQETLNKNKITKRQKLSVSEYASKTTDELFAELVASKVLRKTTGIDKDILKMFNDFIESEGFKL